MYRQMLQITSLLIGSAFLVFAGGINGLILPIRGSAEGFSALSLGLLGTGWAIGYVTGCIVVPRLVSKVGHVRSFSAMAGLAAVSVLVSVLLIHAAAWIPLRGLAGFCFAGAAMIVESWLNERTEPANRGRVFGIYTMVNLTATTAGQLSLTLGDTNTFEFFVIAAIFYCLALMPTALSRRAAPQPLVKANLDLPTLWRASPIAVVGVLLVGVSNSTFGTLGAVYGERVGLDVSTIALFMSASILAGAVVQMPVGFLSDRIDRRLVLIGLAVVAMLVDAVFLILAPLDPAVVLALISVFGGAIFAMYPVIVAHANDHAPPDYYIKTSGGLLLLYGVGSIIGPLSGGVIMSYLGAVGMFATTLLAHVSLIAYSLWRIFSRPEEKHPDKTPFHATAMARSATPQTAVLSSGADAKTEAPD